jgi:hypothetical protein
MVFSPERIAYTKAVNANQPCNHVKMSGLCPNIDYRSQWGNDGKVPIHLGCHYTTQPVQRQCLVRQVLRLRLAHLCYEPLNGPHTPNCNAHLVADLPARSAVGCYRFRVGRVDTAAPTSTAPRASCSLLKGFTATTGGQTRLWWWLMPCIAGSAGPRRIPWNCRS